MDAADFAQIVGGVIALLGFGFAMGFSPTLYGVVLHVLTRSQRPWPSVLALVTGLAAGSTVLLLAFRTVDPHRWVQRLQGQVAAFLVQRVVDLAAAAVFLITGAILLWQARRRPARPKPVRVRRGSTWAMLGIGFVNAAVGVTGPATMYVTGRVLTGMSSSVVWEAIAYIPFLVALTAPYLAVAWAWSRVPKLAEGVTHGYAWLTGRDLRPIVAWALIATSVVFAALGIWAHPSSS